MDDPLAVDCVSRSKSSRSEQPIVETLPRLLLHPSTSHSSHPHPSPIPLHQRTGGGSTFSATAIRPSTGHTSNG